MARPRNKFLESLYLELEELKKKVDTPDVVIFDDRWLDGIENSSFKVEDIGNLVEKQLEIDLISFLNAGYDGEWREQNGDKIFYAKGFFFSRNILTSKEYPQLLRKLARLHRLTNDFNKKRIELEKEILRGKKETLKEKRKLIKTLSLLNYAMKQELSLVVKDLHDYDLKKYNRTSND